MTNQAPAVSTQSAEEAKPLARPHPVLRLLGASRYLFILAIICIFLVATALLVLAAAYTVQLWSMLLAQFRTGKFDTALVLGAIKEVDVVLLATVLYVTAMGLYELFIDENLVLPSWLAVHDLDDLKHKLLSVTITVLAVYYLGYVFTWTGDPSIQALGISIAVVIAALAFYMWISKGPRPGK